MWNDIEYGDKYENKTGWLDVFIEFFELHFIAGTMDL